MEAPRMTARFAGLLLTMGLLAGCGRSELLDVEVVPSLEAGPSSSDTSDGTDARGPVADAGTPMADGGPDAALSCEAGVVFGDGSALAAIAVDDADLYWVELATGPTPSGVVARCDKATCSARETLASGLTEPFDVVLTSTLVFYSDLDGVHGCDKASCSPTLLAPAPETTELAVDARDVWFRAGAGILSCPFGGCSTPSVLASQGTYNFITVAVDDTDVYWVATSYDGATLDPSGEVFTCPKTGCNGPPRLVMTVPYPYYVAVDATDVYVTSGQFGPDSAGAIMTCPKTGCASPTTLAGSLRHPIALTLDATTVYWVDEGSPALDIADGDVASCPKAGCPEGPRFLARHQMSPGAIAVDDACVYWALSSFVPGGGAILRTAK
jgi:hypothetical protein